MIKGKFVMYIEKLVMLDNDELEKMCAEAGIEAKTVK